MFKTINMILSSKIKNVKILFLSLTFALVICLAISVYYYPVTIEGIVDHKAVVGIKDGVAKTILLITPNGVIIKDENIRQYARSVNATSLKEIRSIIHMYYAKVYYTVSIRTLTGDPLNNLAPDETLAYIVGEEYFDMLKIGAKVKFEITRTNPLKISKIVEIKT